MASPTAMGWTELSLSSWTAIITQDEDWWIGWVAEIPGVNAQERTREQLLATLADVLREALELNRQDAVVGLRGATPA